MNYYSLYRWSLDKKTWQNKFYYNSIINKLNQILLNIRSFNISYMLNIYNKTKQSSLLLKNQDIVLLLGYTGAGKSTTFNVLTMDTQRSYG